MRAAIDEARLGAKEGGIPIGSVLVRDGRILGRGHNRRVQKGSAILHAQSLLVAAGFEPFAFVWRDRRRAGTALLFDTAVTARLALYRRR